MSVFVCLSFLCVGLFISFCVIVSLRPTPASSHAGVKKMKKRKRKEWWMVWSEMHYDVKGNINSSAGQRTGSKQ